MMKGSRCTRWLDCIDKGFNPRFEDFFTWCLEESNNATADGSSGFCVCQHGWDGEGCGERVLEVGVDVTLITILALLVFIALLICTVRAYALWKGGKKTFVRRPILLVALLCSFFATMFATFSLLFLCDTNNRNRSTWGICLMLSYLFMHMMIWLQTCIYVKIFHDLKQTGPAVMELEHGDNTKELRRARRSVLRVMSLSGMIALICVLSNLLFPSFVFVTDINSILSVVNLLILFELVVDRRFVLRKIEVWIKAQPRHRRSYTRVNRFFSIQIFLLLFVIIATLGLGLRAASATISQKDISVVSTRTWCCILVQVSCTTLLSQTVGKFAETHNGFVDGGTALRRAAKGTATIFRSKVFPIISNFAASSHHSQHEPEGDDNLHDIEEEPEQELNNPTSSEVKNEEASDNLGQLQIDDEDLSDDDILPSSPPKKVVHLELEVPVIKSRASQNDDRRFRSGKLVSLLPSIVETDLPENGSANAQI